MLRIGLAFGLVATLLSLPLPALGQGVEGPLDADEAKPRLRPNLQTSGLDDDDDLLDPDLDDDGPSAPTAGRDMVVPPHAIKIRLDDESAAIGRAADAAGDEMTDLARMLATDRDRANKEIERRLAEAEGKLVGLRSKVSTLEEELEKTERRTRSKSRKRGTYGTPLVWKAIPRKRGGAFRDTGPVKRAGERQFKWWQKLTLKSTDGLHRRLKELNVTRANQLKSQADALAMTVEQRYRDYANYAIDESVGSSRFANPVRFDNRLKDLLLPGGGGDVPLTSDKQTHKPTKSSRRIMANFDRGNSPLVLLPRVRGPDGRMRVIVDRPLGGPFTAPVASDDSDE